MRRDDTSGRGGRFALALLAGLLAVEVHAEEPAPGEAARDLSALSIEELMNIEVVSVAKKPERRFEAAAALAVVTHADLERSGVTAIPDALRTVPGVHVARIDANKWAVSVRGFSSRFTNKLLVLQDGRSVYTPLFAGVYWDVQDTLLEDVEQIEVIRGPGGTIWGANAVNGVINIITKRAPDTQGWLVSGGAGNEERGFGAVRYGGRVGERLHYRAYAKFFSRDEAHGTDLLAADDWDVGRGGFRADWAPDAENTFTLSGDLYDGNADQRVLQTAEAFNADVAGGHLLGHWDRRLGRWGDATLQWYYDRTERREPAFGEVRNTGDVDFQHRLPLPWRQELNWGLGYRVTGDDLSGDLAALLDDTKHDQLFSAFVQDEIWLVPDRVRLTAGSKFEHNDYSGFEWQPSGRLLWMPAARHALWAAISRAVRTPSRSGDEIIVSRAVNRQVVVRLSDQSEELLAFEGGYRIQARDDLLLAVAAFYNLYDHLTSLESGAPLELLIRNRLDGDVYGAELSGDWAPAGWWTLHAAYSYLDVHLEAESGSRDLVSARADRLSPQHQASLRSFVDLPWDLSFDGVVRYVDNLDFPRLGARPSLLTSSYVELDLRLAYRPLKRLEVAVVGQNLLEDHHQEFREAFPTIAGTEVERSVYGKITWRY